MSWCAVRSCWRAGRDCACGNSEALGIAWSHIREFEIRHSRETIDRGEEWNSFLMSTDLDFRATHN